MGKVPAPAGSIQGPDGVCPRARSRLRVWGGKARMTEPLVPFELEMSSRTHSSSSSIRRTPATFFVAEPGRTPMPRSRAGGGVGESACGVLEPGEAGSSTCAWRSKRSDGSVGPPPRRLYSPRFAAAGDVV